MNKQRTQSVRASVLDEIKSGKVQMRPRIYYVVLGSLSVGAAILAGLSVAYLSSIIFYWMRVQTADTMAWGARANLAEAITTFPWWALAASVLLLMMSVVLIRKQGRMYKLKTSTLVLLIMIFSLLVGLVFSLLDVGVMHTQNRSGSGQGPGWRRMD